jgi:DNA repair exonuclease SbcCD ATPase subunit
MKKYAIIVLMAMVTFACNQEEVDQLTELKTELENEANTKDSTINDMMATFNLIQENLDEIKRRENLVSINTDGDSEMSLGKTEKINRDLQMINKLMVDNKALIESLSSKAKKSGVKISELERMIANLSKRVQSKDAEIASLKEELISMNFKVTELNQSLDEMALENMRKQKALEESIEEINTAYFAYGTYNELNEKNVLTKEGGFLGLGKQKTLKNDFNEEYFSKIDLTKTTSFLIYSKKASLVTTHPEGSYEFKGNDNQIDSLVITNPEEFWKASKYLVVLVD